jgi:hypothetical protein
MATMPTIRIDDEVYALLQSKAEPFTDTPNSVLRRELGLDSSAETTFRDRKAGRRARTGTILSRFEYDVPILTALARRGGSAPMNEVVDDVGEMLAERLTELDKQPVRSGEIRWRNRAMWRRLRLVKSGLLKEDSPRGIWELSEAGWERVKQEEGPPRLTASSAPEEPREET